MMVFGTRPEVIKMLPVIKEFEKHSELVKVVNVVTSQHKEMISDLIQIFDIRKDYDFDIMEKNQGLAELLSRLLTKLTPVIEAEKPDLIMVQGDTTTTFAASLASYYHKIPVAHIEAGLRTGNRYSPFPEEVNRCLTTTLSTIHFSPTEKAKNNLLREGVVESSIYVTGNTVVDALFIALDKCNDTQTLPGQQLVTKNNLRKILVTTHRRESFGRPIQEICRAIKYIIEQNNDVEILYSVHMNPKVRKTVLQTFKDTPRVTLLEHHDYLSFVTIMNNSYIILTDSGGIQEEAPYLGKPVLVLREESERSEAIEAGGVKLVGRNYENIVMETQLLLADFEEYNRMTQKANPYGDGQASKRIVKHVFDYFNIDQPE